MRKQDYKGRCEKRQLSKCEGVFKSYDALQTKYALMLEDNEEVIEIKGNVPLDGLEEGKYIADKGEYLLQKMNGLVNVSQVE